MGAWIYTDFTTGLDPKRLKDVILEFTIYIIFNDKIATDTDIGYRFCDATALSEQL